MNKYLKNLNRIECHMNKYDRSKQVERITRYEEIMHRAEQMIRDYSEDSADLLRDLIAELEWYYSSDEWKQDFEADEAGLLPSDLKRGVLSEDGIYDLLEECRALIDEGEDDEPV